MMKETKKSLKVYFIVVGVLGILSGIIQIKSNSDFTIKTFGITTLVLAVMFFYYGIKMRDYLQKSPKKLINLVIITLAVQVLLNFLRRDIVQVIGVALLSWYLIHNIKKLSTQTAVIENKK